MELVNKAYHNYTLRSGSRNLKPARDAVNRSQRFSKLRKVKHDPQKS